MLAALVIAAEQACVRSLAGQQGLAEVSTTFGTGYPGSDKGVTMGAWQPVLPVETVKNGEAGVMNSKLTADLLAHQGEMPKPGQVRVRR